MAFQTHPPRSIINESLQTLNGPKASSILYYYYRIVRNIGRVLYTNSFCCCCASSSRPVHRLQMEQRHNIIQNKQKNDFFFFFFRIALMLKSIIMGSISQVPKNAFRLFVRVPCPTFPSCPDAINRRVNV